MTIDSSLVGTKRLLRVLAGERLETPPIWIMRQAGRYLPEYREIRAQAKTFLDFCYAPSLAAEAVLQPLRRFDLDAAILFSDILVIPDALGRKVEFLEGEGPRLPPLLDETNWRFEDVERAIQRLAPVYETVDRLSKALPAPVTLIGFAGSPWTVATYMLQGQGGEKDRSRRGAYERPEEVDALLELLVEATARHLEAQAKAGAEVLQIFESWAEGLSESLFERVVLKPTTALVKRLRALGVTQPVIGFPRGAGLHYPRYAAETGVNALGLDTSVPVSRLRAFVPKEMALQGNLDPQLLVLGGQPLRDGVAKVLAAFEDRPHIFNLGHGITPEAKPEHVAELVAAVKSSAA